MHICIVHVMRLFRKLSLHLILLCFNDEWGRELSLGTSCRHDSESPSIGHEDLLVCNYVCTCYDHGYIIVLNRCRQLGAVYLFIVRARNCLYSCINPGSSWLPGRSIVIVRVNVDGPLVERNIALYTCTFSRIDYEEISREWTKCSEITGMCYRDWCVWPRIARIFSLIIICVYIHQSVLREFSHHLFGFFQYSQMVGHWDTSSFTYIYFTSVMNSSVDRDLKLISS